MPARWGGGHDLAFVAAGGFAEDLSAGLGAEESDEPAVAGGGVGRAVKARDPVELEVLLGTAQARVESVVHSVPAHSCGCEPAWVGRSINGSSIGDGRERLELPAHWAWDPRQAGANLFAPRPSRQPAGRPFPLLPRTIPEKDRGQSRSKIVEKPSRGNLNTTNGSASERNARAANLNAAAPEKHALRLAS